MHQKIIEFLKANEAKIALFLGLILIAAISFETGLIQGKKGQNSPLIVEKASFSGNCGPEAASGQAPEASKTARKADLTAQSSTTLPANCAFVGSKNSDKFHAPACTFAKRILPKNLVCFKSAEEATAQGRQGDKGCIK